MKNVLITGANRGLGFELAKQLAERGNHVILTGRNKEGLDLAKQKLLDENSSLSLDTMVLDMEDSSSFSGFHEKLKTKYSSLEILIHNAAIIDNVDREGSILSLPEDVIRKTFDINAVGPILLTQYLIPLMSQGSRIVNISARPALFKHLNASTKYPAYRLSKLLFHGWSVILAKELEEKQIIVTNMHPGWIKTDMGGADATFTVEEGADTAVWLALEAPQDVHGKFYMERKPLDW